MSIMWGKNKMKISTMIRFILTIVLIYFVYKETGIATTIAISLICIGIELNTYLIK